LPSLKKFFEAVDYKVHGGFKYGWRCYGKNAFALDAGNFQGWFEDDVACGYWSACVVYDLDTQKVMEINYINQYEPGEAGRWIHPQYVRKSKSEAKKRGLSHTQAYDDVHFKELGERAILSRLSAIAKKKKRKKK
jgi:hypothetical protein